MWKVVFIYLPKKIYFVNKFTDAGTPVVRESKFMINWTAEQKEVTLEYFKENIQKNKEPTEIDVEDFKNQCICMKNEHWTKIRTFVLEEYNRTAELQNTFERHEDTKEMFLHEQGWLLCNLLNEIYSLILCYITLKI